MTDEDKDLIANIALISVTYESMGLADFFYKTASLFQNVWIVDNCSEDETEIYFKKQLPNANFIKLSKNFGFGFANNVGFNESLKNCSYALFLNPDCSIKRNDILGLLRALKNETNAVIACPVIFDQHGRADSVSLRDYGKGYSHKVIDKILFSEELPELIEGACIQGSCFLVDSKKFQKIGAFDDKIFMYSEEDDISLRAINSKFNILVNTKCHAVHLGGASSKQSIRLSIRKSYASKWSIYYMTEKYISPKVRLIAVFKTMIFSPFAIVGYILLGRKANLIKWIGWFAASIDGVFLTKIFLRLI
jgi:N-acetylglucosaminyl-diphospho-decaprenol L-rhamnosyltransferase